jgi:hypothetical protein
MTTDTTLQNLLDDESFVAETAPERFLQERLEEARAELAANRDAAPVSSQYDSRPDTFTHIAVVRQYLLWVATSLIGRAHMHDQSKVFPPEVEGFDEWTPKLREVEYGTPEYEECRTGLGVTLEHHYANNDHHPEHFPNGIADMDLLQLTEMLCDWLAAVQRHPHGDIERSLVLNSERFDFGPEIERLLRNTVKTIAQNFEAQA